MYVYIYTYMYIYIYIYIYIRRRSPPAADLAARKKRPGSARTTHGAGKPATYHAARALPTS